MEPMTTASVAIVQALTSETMWAIVAGMAAIKAMDIWDRRLLRDLEREHHRKPRKRAHRAHRKAGS